MVGKEMVFPPEKKERTPPTPGKGPKTPKETDFPRAPPWAPSLPPASTAPAGSTLSVHCTQETPQQCLDQHCPG